MAKQQYRFFGRTKWQGLSGNAILAFTNTVGSGKKISVSNIEIYNNTLLGRNLAANTNSPAPARIKIGYVSSIVGGESITPDPMDSSGPSWPSTVQVKTESSFDATMVACDIARTDSTHAAGSLTFTATTPGWLANEHSDAGRYLVVTSGNNIGTYKIVSNTTTALTLERPLGSPGTQSAQPTTGTISQYPYIFSTGVLKQSAPTIAALPLSGIGSLGLMQQSGTGSLIIDGTNSNNQDITIRAGEKVAIYCDNVTCNFPMMLEVAFNRKTTPNRTYTTTYFTSLDANNKCIMSIDNNAGSGETIELHHISVVELGTVDTPYMQLVPIGSVDPSAYDDIDKILTVDANNSADPALSSLIGQAFTNVPILPFGVPISYLAEGSAGSPKGFSYLNTKDFLGPVYMTFFPEAVAYAEQNTTFWTAGGGGTLNTHVNMSKSFIKGQHAPIILREGEGIAIVSGAETATITSAVGVSAWANYTFGATLTVENSVTPTIELTGLKVGSEVRAYVGTDPATNVELYGNESTVGTSISFTHDSAGSDGYIVIFHLDWLPVRLDFTPYLAAVVSIPVQQTTERNYSNL